MPRGKYVNHKGRHRKFTEPEELQKQSEEESTEEENSSGEDEAGGSSEARGAKPKATKPGKKSWRNATDSTEDSDESEEEDRDAKKGVASLIEIENPNRRIKKLAQKVDGVSLDVKPELSRREREQIEKQKARRHYEQLRAEGKTAEAKADLARLALIKQQRAEAAAKREAEKKAAEERKTADQSNSLKH